MFVISESNDLIAFDIDTYDIKWARLLKNNPDGISINSKYLFVSLWNDNDLIAYITVNKTDGIITQTLSFDF